MSILCACIAREGSISFSASINGERRIPAAFWTRYCAAPTRPRANRKRGGYGGGSQIAEEGFAELGVEEEPLPADDPEEGRFDIEAIVGCELYTESGVHVGKIVRVVPAKTDLYIVERDGREVRLPAEEGVVLGMDVAKKRMTVAAENFLRRRTNRNEL